MSMHKACMGAVQETCTGVSAAAAAAKKKKERSGGRPQSIFGNIIKRNLSTNNPAASTSALCLVKIYDGPNIWMGFVLASNDAMWTHLSLSNQIKIRQPNKEGNNYFRCTIVKIFD